MTPSASPIGSNAFRGRAGDGVAARRVGCASSGPEPGLRGLPRILCLATLLLVLFPLGGLASGKTALVWTFEAGPVGAAPEGWETVAGSWSVQLDQEGNHVVAEAGDPRATFGLSTILAPLLPLTSARVSVDMKPLGNTLQDTVALILRWRSADDQTLLRLEGGTGWLWVERHLDGQRMLRASYTPGVAHGEWNRLLVADHGRWLNVFFNGRFLGGLGLDASGPGRVGLAAEPGARVLLDAVRLEPLDRKAPEEAGE